MPARIPHSGQVGPIAPGAEIAIGIMAYNEEGNIGNLLDGALHQSADRQVERIVVMASGCTDRTCEIIGEYAKVDPRVELVDEPERRGKVHAINGFLRLVRQPLCIVTSADIGFKHTTVERLAAPFADPAVGMVGAHVVPVNTPDTFVGFTVNLMWTLHHEVSLAKPKMGEICAFRNVIPGLDPATLNDEMAVLYEIERLGYRVAYAPDAVIENCGPDDLRDFVKQRTRWIVANLSVEQDYAMHVSTRSTGAVLRATLKHLRGNWRRLPWFAGAAGVELYARACAHLEYRSLRRRHRHFQVWDQIATTKSIAEKKL